MHSYTNADFSTEVTLFEEKYFRFVGLHKLARKTAYCFVIYLQETFPHNKSNIKIWLSL